MTDELINLPPLEAAIWKYMERSLFIAGLREMAREGFPFITPSSEDEISSLLQEIYSLLGKDSPIRSAEEVEHLIRAEFTQLFDEKKLPNFFDPAILKQMVSVFAAKLKEPLRTWYCVASIGHSSQFELHQTLGESDQLSFMMKKEEKHIRPMLGARIEATNELLCRNIVEDLVRSIDGMSFALGLAEADPISLVVKTVWLSLGGPYDREIPLHLAVGGLCPRIVFRIPGDVDDLERRQLQQGAIEEVLRRRVEPLVEVMRSNQERARELRNAGALLFDAYAARDDGNGIAMALMALEAMLLEKADSANTVARLSEAVTYRLGTTASKRVEFRRKIKGLYGVRSVYIHTGRLDKRLGDRRTALAIAKEVLRKELEAFVFEAA